MSNKLTQDKRDFDKTEVQKFIKFFVLKSTQIIVQARLGERIRTESNPGSSHGSDWFNIAIFDHPDVLNETRKALQLSQSDSITTRLPLCVEISLQTVEGDKMILEVWSISLIDQCDPSLRALYAIYNRMGILLKSLISVTRVTPAYKLSRRQSVDSYNIYYRIYSGAPQEHNLGEGYKQVRVGQLCTPLGTLNMAVAYRTKMTISPTTLGRDNPLISVQGDHFFKDVSPKHNRYAVKKSEKKVIDIEKPMRCGAFVDVSRVKQYTEDDFSLPETPPFSWLLRNKRDEVAVSVDPEAVDPLASSPSDENSGAILNTNNSPQQQNNNNASMKSLERVASTSPKSAEPGTSPSSLPNEFRRSSSRWSTRTLPGEDEKLLKELHFPFATQNTPISDLAKFYRECFNAPPLQQFSEKPEKDVLEDEDLGAVAVVTEEVVRNNSIDDITNQLEKFEISLNDYDTLVTSLCQQSNEIDSNSNS